MKLNLSGLEKRLQNLVEGSASLFFSVHKKKDHLVACLLEAFHQGLQVGAEGEKLVPNLFILGASPEQAEQMQNDRGLMNEMHQLLQQAAVRAGAQFIDTPVIRIHPAADLKPGEFRVHALNSRQGLPQTSDIEISAEAGPHQMPPGAFFIVNGESIFPLTLPVINIGRRPDNQLVIDDVRVSRLHAQLRAVQNHFLIFDLDSTGGTFINGERIRQGVLKSGDVISISGVPLVYGEREAPQEMQ